VESKDRSDLGVAVGGESNSRASAPAAHDRRLRVGVVFPTTEIGTDPGVLADYAAALEGLGFDHVTLWDHVVGVGRATRPDWQGTWDSSHPFHEPLTTLAWFAAMTRRVELVTAVLVLPQRQTVVVAKQAAQIDLLSGGRLRLGVGVGHNSVEYDVLGHAFRTRGRRLDEQIALLRRLWDEETVTFDGDFDTVVDAGILPRPARLMPIWVGGSGRAALRRVAQLGDGWLAHGRPVGANLDFIAELRRAAMGRSCGPPGIDGRIDLFVPDTVAQKYEVMAPVPRVRWVDEVQLWAQAGATHVTFCPLFGGYAGAEHISLLEDIGASVLDVRR
jgi:probable F420-dependent oxidoreductase